MDGTPQGLEIVHKGHRTRLKWHRLRRSWDDPLFSAEVMADGFRLGASMELDLRVTGDGGFVVLHDERLEGETTGQGEIATLDRAEIARATFPDGRPLTFSEDLAASLSNAHPDALLQFDMKDFLPAIGARGVAHLAEHFTDPPCPLIVSGDDSNLIVEVKKAIPSLKRGVDPTNPMVDAFKADGLAAVEALLRAELTGPAEPETIYLAWQLILECAVQGLDLIGLCHDAGKTVDAWTYTLKTPATGFSDAEWAQFSALMALKPDQVTTDEAVATERAWRARMSG